MVGSRRVIVGEVAGEGDGGQAVWASGGRVGEGVMDIQLGAEEEGTGMAVVEGIRCTVVGVAEAVVLCMVVGVEEEMVEEESGPVEEGVVERGRDRQVEVENEAAVVENVVEEAVTVGEVEIEGGEAVNVVEEVNSEERVAVAGATTLEAVVMVVEETEVVVGEV